VALPLLLAACTRPVVVVEGIPQNTPPGSRIFITGDFNRWDPGDQRFIVEMGSDSNYYAKLPAGFGTINFKFTRGDWTSVETDLCGYDISNRTLSYHTQDTLFLKIESWRDLDAVDCPEVIVVVDKIPENTPQNDPIAIAGDFNEWLPDSSTYMKKDPGSGRYYLKIPRMTDKRAIEFLVTRGNLLTAETDKQGNEVDKRRLVFGKEDTVFIAVENWQDMQDNSFDGVVVILDEIPPEKPKDRIYITGTFNGWFPRDEKYRFTKNAEGKYQVNIPREGNAFEFKITRGDWSKEEVDALGYKKSNSRFEFGTADTLRLNIDGWLDRSEVRQPSFVLIIDSLPETTPANANIYMASSMRAWRPDYFNYKFTRSPQGFYYLNLDEVWRSFEYKITLGDWKYQELDEFGLVQPNRQFEYNGQDTVTISVKNWQNLPPVKQKIITIILDTIPAYTPGNAKIYITGSFNNWNPANPKYILKKNHQGKYFINITRSHDEIEFKFTLGSWDYEEQDRYFRNIPNRFLRFGYNDTLYLSIHNWKRVP